LVLIPLLEGYNYMCGHGVSHDGQVIAGYGYSSSTGETEAFRWTEAEGMVGLGSLPGWDGQSNAQAVSADGSAIVGWVGPSSTSGPMQAFRWENGVMEGMGYLPGGDMSHAYGISADGEVIVGWSHTADGSEPFRWSAATGMVGLGYLPGGAGGTARDASADGSVIVGDAYDGTRGTVFLWDETNGKSRLEDILTEELGLDLGEWRLSEGYGISDDGLTITGYGVNPQGRNEAFIAHVPEPASSLLVLAGLTIACFGRRAFQWVR